MLAQARRLAACLKLVLHERQQMIKYGIWLFAHHRMAAIHYHRFGMGDTAAEQTG